MYCAKGKSFQWGWTGIYLSLQEIILKSIINFDKGILSNITGDIQEIKETLFDFAKNAYSAL